ncbi:RNA polymerase sigma factor [Paenibacillus uliginis]|uniref:RNA polymerase sigma factor n=1 Tax=Paenibacillus uliginis TaxID=683737 RepID=UPI001FCD610A|nr:sigma factor-like helix-turn-helix DNA-binding protein [Paenibacillus uliginis]
MSRTLESSSDLTGYESRLISLDFTKHVEIRFDISSAVKTLGPLDNQIILLRFFVDCTIAEISEIVGMREIAVKNRLYRTLDKLKVELKETYLTSFREMWRELIRSINMFRPQK